MRSYLLVIVCGGQGLEWPVCLCVCVTGCVCLFVYHIHHIHVVVTVRVFANMMNLSMSVTHCVYICTPWTGDTGAPPPCITVPIQTQWTLLSSDINSQPQRNHVQVHFKTSHAANYIQMLYCSHWKSMTLTYESNWQYRFIGFGAKPGSGWQLSRLDGYPLELLSLLWLSEYLQC